MANMFQMMKQMREVRKLQKALESQTFEAKSPDGTVAVVSRGDMSIKSLRIDPKVMDPATAERLEKTIVSTMNNALEGAKKAAAANMSKLTEGLGDLGALKGMLGG
jgi:nucleoid-associated protein EbfC